MECMKSSYSFEGKVVRNSIGFGVTVTIRNAQNDVAGAVRCMCYPDLPEDYDRLESMQASDLIDVAIAQVRGNEELISNAIRWQCEGEKHSGNGLYPLISRLHSSKQQHWFEVWADDGHDVPYVLVLLYQSGRCVVRDPKESDRLVFGPATYDECRLWLLEDEFVCVRGVCSDARLRLRQ